MKKRDELESLYKKHLKREREIVDHINANSHEMTKEEIQELDKERRKCVEDRREVKKKMAVLDDVLNVLGKRDKSAVQILAQMLSDVMEESE